MKILTTLALFITIAVIIYVCSLRVQTVVPPGSADADVIPGNVAPAAVTVTPGVRAPAPHTRYKQDLDQANGAADSIRKEREEADEAGK